MSFNAEWKGPIEGYVTNFLTKNYWKVARTCPREDVMQEAYCVFLRCKRKYPHIEEPKHFMALFKTAWYHEFMDLANADTEQRVEQQPLENESGEILESIGELNNDGMLAVMIRQAPAEVNTVLSLFLNAPQELLDLALGSWRSTADGRFKAGGVKHINQLLGLPEDFDSIKTVTEYFTV